LTAFSRISGGHANPAQLLGHAEMHFFFYMRTGRFTLFFRNLLLVAVGMLFQFAGWLVAASIILGIANGSKTTDLGVPKLGSINGALIPQGEGFLVILVHATIYALVYGLVIIDKAVETRMERFLSMGLSSVALSSAFVGLSGACINPFRWLCGSIILNDYNISNRNTTDGWTYIVGPFVAFCLIMPFMLEIWRMLIEPTSTATMENDYQNIISAPEFPPTNKYHQHYKEKQMRTGEDHGLTTIKQIKQSSALLAGYNFATTTRNIPGGSYLQQRFSNRAHYHTQ
jgi:glycerol uptake facilitator-like aquaporin